MNNLDDVVAGLYSAAVNRTSWNDPLQAVSRGLDLWATQIIGVDKRRGGLVFSAGGWGAQPQPEVELDYIRFYHTINPRLAPSMQLSVGEWFHCHKVFDDGFVQHNPFYQEFLIPHGGRFLSGVKLIENDQHVFLLGMMRGVGKPPLGDSELESLRSVARHAVQALLNHLHVRAQFAEKEMAHELLEQFPYAMLVLDETRGIWHMNAYARKLLDSGDVLQNVDGRLMCGNANANNELTEAMRALYVGSETRTADAMRRVVTIPRKEKEPLRLFVSSLRPEQSMNMFGVMPRSLVIVHDSSELGGELDPVLVAECFSLTPAEARVAIKLVAGMGAKEIANAFGTCEATVRTQIQRTLEKAGVSRQSDLIRLLLSMPLRKKVKAASKSVPTRAVRLRR